MHVDAVSSAGSRVAWPSWLGRSGSGVPTARNEETERDKKIKQKVMEGLKDVRFET